jgi:hypothetical protein
MSFDPQSVLSPYSRTGLLWFHNGQLILTDSVSIPLFGGNEGREGPADLSFTSEERRVSCLTGAAVMAHRHMVLFGERRSGKTYAIHSLAQLVGAPLGVVQFNPHTDTASMIVALEIDGDPSEVQKLHKQIKLFTKRIIALQTVHSFAFAVSTIGGQVNFKSDAKY